MIIPNLKNKGFLMWAAAWLDTEGHIGIREGIQNSARNACPSFRVTCGVSQIVDVPLRLLRKAFGGHIGLTPARNRSKPIYRWTIHSAGAVRMLKAVLPHLTVKTKQAELAVKAGDTVSAGVRGRWYRRPEAEILALRQIKETLNGLNGWNQERVIASRVITKRRGPRPLKRWSKDYDSCLNCGTTALVHIGHGLCRTCHARHWRQQQQRDYDKHKPGPKGPRMPVSVQLAPPKSRSDD